MRQKWMLWPLLVVFLLVGCSADEWETYRLRSDPGYSIAIPEDAEREIPQAGFVGIGGERVELDVRNFSKDGAIYTVAQGTLAAEADSAAEIDAILRDAQFWLDPDVRRASTLDSSALSWNGYPGRAFRFDTFPGEESGQTRAHILLVEEDLYILRARGPEDVINARADRFLSSFDTAED